MRLETLVFAGAIQLGIVGESANFCDSVNRALYVSTEFDVMCEDIYAGGKFVKGGGTDML